MLQKNHDRDTDTPAVGHRLDALTTKKDRDLDVLGATAPTRKEGAGTEGVQQHTCTQMDDFVVGVSVRPLLVTGVECRHSHRSCQQTYDVSRIFVRLCRSLHISHGADMIYKPTVLLISLQGLVQRSAALPKERRQRLY